MPALEIPNLTGQQIAQRMLNLFPRGWAGDTAGAQGGILWALINALSAQIALILGDAQYAQAASRIKTAYNGALDIISNDYFGTALPRLPNESDASFQARILKALLQPRVTRAALAAAIQQLTGNAPRMIEPWNPGDTGAWDSVSYYDYDTQGNPSLWGDGSLRYQGMIDATLPYYQVSGGWPVWCFDAGASFDIPQSYWIDPAAVPISQSTLAALEALILAYKAEGTTIWLKIGTPPINLASGILTVPANGYQVQQLGPPNQLQMINGGDFAIFAEPALAATPIWVAPEGYNFILNLGVAVPQPNPIGWLAMSFMQPSVLHVEIPTGATALTIYPPDGIGTMIPIVLPSWNTTAWVALYAPDGENVTSVTLEFGTPSPGGHVNVAFFPAIVGGTAAIAAAANTVSIPLAATLPYGFFAVPSWNTSIGLVQKTNVGVQLEFSVPAPTGGGEVYWVVQEQI